MSFEPKLRRIAALAIFVLAAVVVGSVLAGSRDKKDAEDTPAAPDTPAPRAFWVGDEGGPYLGVHIEEDAESEEGGARITEVVDDSPADHAGLQDGDVIVTFNGATVRGPAGLTKQIRSHEAGDKVTIVVLRDGKKKTIEAELANRASAWKAWKVDPDQLVPLQNLEDLGPEIEERVRAGLKGLEKIELPEGALQFYRFPGRARLGVQLVEATPELRQHFGGNGEAGVLVSKIIKGMPAEHAGVQVGDLIVSIAGQPIESVSDLREALADRSGDTFQIEVIRNRDHLQLEVTLPDEDDEDDSAGPRAFLRSPLPPRTPLPALAPAPPMPPPPPRARVRSVV